MPKVVTCVGARPNFMKVSRLKHLFLEAGVDYTLLHTGQHYDSRMSDVFFQDLGMDPPDVYLEAKGNSQLALVADVISKSGEAFQRERPDLVIVPGDVNSTFACAFAANRLGLPVAHLEAGLRSFDMTMPEEVNRILIDNLSNYHFVTEKSGVQNLRDEGFNDDGIFFVGNTMIDALVDVKRRVDEVPLESRFGIRSDFILATFHRPGNVDVEDNINEVVKSINMLAELSNVVFPVHPRTKQALEKYGLEQRFSDRVQLLPPLGYIEFISLVVNAVAVYTDSGGIQEETAFLGIPCYTIRPNTERPATIEAGTNVLLSLDAREIQSSFAKQLERKTFRWDVPPLWDGATSDRIIKICLNSIL